MKDGGFRRWKVYRYAVNRFARNVCAPRIRSRRTGLRILVIDESWRSAMQVFKQVLGKMVSAREGRTVCSSVTTRRQ